MLLVSVLEGTALCVLGPHPQSRQPDYNPSTTPTRGRVTPTRGCVATNWAVTRDQLSHFRRFRPRILSSWSRTHGGLVANARGLVANARGVGRVRTGVGRVRTGGWSRTMNRNDGCDPNQVTFEEGVRPIQAAAAKVGIKDQIGDWMFIPQGRNTSFEVGKFGALNVLLLLLLLLRQASRSLSS